MFHVTYAQEEKPEQCGTVFRPELNKYHIDEVEAITKFTADQANLPLTIEIVPVRLTVFNGPATIGISQSNMDQALSNLNAAYQGTGLNFVQCGPINFIHRPSLGTNSDYISFLPRFSYTSGTLELFLNNAQNGSVALHPCPLAYQDGNPNYNLTGACTLYDNIAKIENLNKLLTSTLPHEVGHHFGLFHTFMNEGSSRHTPVDSNQVDHPYPVLDVNDEIIPTWWGRELVIRNDDQNKLFSEENIAQAGDLVYDTPADCNPQSSSAPIYPGCLLTAQATGCIINNTLTYKDYNEDAIYPPPAGLSLGRNFMSYWTDTCRNQFTDGQRERILYYYNTYRKPKYAPEKCGLFDDKVEFEGSETGIPMVTIRTRHTNDTRVSNLTTSPQGTFSGLLFHNTLKARIYHNGLGGFTPPITQFQILTDSIVLASRYLHTPCEWTRGVTVTDIVAIQKHILGLEPLTSGYSIIAADASKNNQVTVFDIVELRKLILGLYTKLPAFEQPWRFVPEFVPQDNSSAFNTTPFSMTIGGNNIGATYLEQDWEFTVPTSLSKRGFDAIKIGDVNSSWPTGINCENPKEDEAEKPALLVPAVSLDQEDEVELQFKIAAFSDITAYQLGFRLDPELLQIQDVKKVTQELNEYNKTDHFSIEADSGYVRTLWLDTSLEGKSLSQDSIVFSLLVKTKTFVPNLQSAISIDWMALPSVFMDENGVVEKIEEISIEVDVAYKSEERNETLRSSDTTGTFLRCFPNPFSDKMHIVFDYEGSATGGLLTVTNMFGQNVTERNVNIQKGRNVITVNGLGDIGKGAHIATLILDGNSYQVQVIKK